MRILSLYHGGEKPVIAPEVFSPKAIRSLDFGSGFYTTTSIVQARKWVNLRIRQHVYQSGCVSRYTIDVDAIYAADLKMRIFNGPEEAWFDFIIANRHTIGFEHDFDLVKGPVANDNVYETLTLFEDSLISKQEAIGRLKTYTLVDQILFHTQKALEFLRFEDSEVVE